VSQGRPKPDDGIVAKSPRCLWFASTNVSAGRLLFIVFAGLQVADIVTTDRALAVPGNWEANPLMAFAQAHLGEAWWLPKLAILGFVFVAAPLTRRLWPMAFAVSYYVLIVSGNIICL